VELSVKTNFSEKRAVSIFRAEYGALKMELARFFETLASTIQSPRRINPKEHYQVRYGREDLKSDNYSFFSMLLLNTVKEQVSRTSHRVEAANFS
jgi:hypothetical protein